MSGPRSNGDRGPETLDLASRPGHHEAVGEYGGIAASLAVLVVSLTAALGATGALPSLDSKATALVSAAASRGTSRAPTHARRVRRGAVPQAGPALPLRDGVGQCGGRPSQVPGPAAARPRSQARSGCRDQALTEVPCPIARRASHREPGFDGHRPRHPRRLRLNGGARRREGAGHRRWAYIPKTIRAATRPASTSAIASLTIVEPACLPDHLRPARGVKREDLS